MSKRANKLRTSPETRILGTRSFAAISAVEGLSLSHASKKRLAAVTRSKLSPQEQRLQIIKAYSERKKRG